MKRRIFPLFGAVGFLSLAIGYSAWTTHVGCNAAGLLDHASLIMMFLLMNELLRPVHSSGARSAGRFALIAILAIFFFLNTLHFRFFHTWGDAAAARQWEDLLSIWSSLKVLSKPADLIFFLAGPLAAWVLLRQDMPPKISKLTLVLLTLGFATAHAFLASPELLYNENDPFMTMLRRQGGSWLTRSSAEGLGTEDTAGGGPYELVNSSLYKMAGRTDYPLLKIPLPNSRPLPFQVDKKPNVVLVLMESVRAYESGAYGAAPSLTPTLDRLAREGFLFKNFYANSYQTARGEFAIHSSYLPAVQGSPEYIVKPHLSLITWPSLLKRHGYATLWIGSYKPTYDNKQEFLSHHGIDSFFSSVPKGYRKVGWGPSDEDLFNYAFDVLAAQRAPYFAEIMTLSNHFPWDDGAPTSEQTPKVKGESMYQKYAQGIFYTDYAIGKFMDRISASRRFDNTIFIFCGDHGIWLFPDSVPASSALRQEVYFRVPLIFWSRRLSPRGIETVGSQIDIGPTVLDLLGLRDKNYFQGTSLFRHDIATRFVLMSQDGRWNMRRGNVFTYDVGPELFKTHYPFNEVEYDRLVKNKHMEHVDFTTDEDLLRRTDPQYFKLLADPGLTHQLHNFAEAAFAFYHGLMLADKIAPPEEISPPAPKN
jgi:arylsulfatase A-like enzyme